MTRLLPEKLRVNYLPGTNPKSPTTLRFYTLTHSDRTGELFLSIGQCCDSKATFKLYTRLIRDEALAELNTHEHELSLNGHCHVSGGFAFGTAKMRYDIFCSELSLVLEAIRFGDRSFFEEYPDFDPIPVVVYFNSTNKKFNKKEKWGLIGDYKL